MEYTEQSQAILEKRNYTLTEEDLAKLKSGLQLGIEFTRRLQKNVDVPNVVYLNFLNQLKSFVYRGYISFAPFKDSVGYTEYLCGNLIGGDSFSKKYTENFRRKEFNVGILFYEYLLDCINLISEGFENDFYLRNLEVLLDDLGKVNIEIAEDSKIEMASALKTLNRYAII